MNFFKINEKYKPTSNLDEITLPGTKLTYDEALIEKLKKDHRKLLRMYASCISANQKKKHIKLVKLLRQLKIKYTAHLLLENTRFYTYIKHYFKSDTSNSVLIKRLFNDMEKNGRLVFQFLDRSTETNKVFDEEFGEELEETGFILRERFIASERELYFLYQPPDI